MLIDFNKYQCNKYKRNSITVLSHYPEIRTIRKLTKVGHILRRPLGLTIDADYYDRLRVGTDLVYFEISDGRVYTITADLLDKSALTINRADRGRQYVANFKDLTQVKPEPIEQYEPVETNEHQFSMFGGDRW